MSKQLTSQPADFAIRPATVDEIPALVEHYTDVIAKNNATGSRYIDWSPFSNERLAPIVANQRLLIIEPKSGVKAPIISASVIIDRTPDPQLWEPSDLPDHALGFSKFAVSASLLGQNFGRTVAMPLLVTWALAHDAKALYCDALPHLDNYYSSLGFRKIGAASFFSNYYQKEVLVHKHVRIIKPENHE